MSVFYFLLQGSRRSIALIGLTGLVSGVCGAGLIALINFALHDTQTSSFVLGLGFLALMTGKILTGAFSQQFLFRLSQRTTLEMSVSLSRELAYSSLRRVECIGTPRIMAILADDVQALGAAIQSVPSFMANFALLAGCSVYLLLLSWKAFLMLLVPALFGFLIYRMMLAKTQVSLKIVREKRDTLYGHFRSLTEGVKELRINRTRRWDFLENHLSKTIEELKFHGQTAIRCYVWTDAINQVFFYSVLGLLLFGIPSLSRLPVATQTGYVFAIIYLMGPIWALIYALPSLQKGRIALEKIEEFRRSLSTDPGSASQRDDPILPWKTLQMQDIVFSYEDGDEGDSRQGFVLGPIDFQLSPGELVFVVGGNGCGKSTFVKLLCGLYKPRSGKILLDGRRMTDGEMESYRQYFSVVFSDFFLFDSLLGVWSASQESRVHQYLSLLQLDKKVSIREGRFSTIALSQGQRRRLALLGAYLEDRPIYVFDEWAADQDPAYKEVFYKSLLPELRRKGKGVVVITHDDRYFGLGDRVVKLDYGTVLEVSPNAAVLS